MEQINLDALRADGYVPVHIELAQKTKNLTRTGWGLYTTMRSQMKRLVPRLVKFWKSYEELL